MLSRLLEKLSERSVDEREAIWVEGILSRQKVEIPKNLRLSFENMNQQIELLNRARAMSEMSELMNLQN